MILPAQEIRRRGVSSAPMIWPFVARSIHNGMTFGLRRAGYDVRIAETVWFCSRRFVLASTIERFEMPTTVLAQVCDKSSWARRGVAVQNTIIEPGWRGHLTLEITYACWRSLRICAGDPIAQI